MNPVRVRRLDLDVRGLDPALVRAALELLPERLTGALGADPGEGADGGSGPLRFDAVPSAAELAGRMARRVAGEVRSSGEVRLSGGDAPPPRGPRSAPPPAGRTP